MATPRKATLKPPTQKTDVVTAPPKPSAPAAALPSEKIAQRAYEIWVASGRPDGQQESHWYAAERELRARLGR
jgi:hypothetical protein